MDKITALFFFFKVVKKVFFLEDESYFTDTKSDHTEALPAKIMVFPDILKQHSLTTQCFI